MSDDQRHILVLRFSALGDVAMTLPVVYSFARSNPDVKFTMVTRPFFSRLFIDAPANLSVIGIDPKDYKGMAGLWRLFSRLGRLHPTDVADLHNVLRSWMVDNYFRAKGVRVVMVDKMRSARSSALKNKIRQKSFIDRYIDVFKKLGLMVPEAYSALTPLNSKPPVEISHPAVGIAPFARYHTKTYPSEMMVEVIRLLCSNGIAVYLFGGPGDEADQLSGWARMIDGCQSLAGLFPIEQELRLMQEMDQIVSMDSANQHLASLVGTPVVTLWGSTTPECGFSPFGQQDRGGAIVKGVGCQPCNVAGAPACPRSDFACMRSLEPEVVASRVLSALTNKKQ
ncbi:MAG: glycosyltransferase family 9 protein [Paramuribaculum sp.]|nr:glycosyltransferase family 9 protein [Paramuribaculum sp.]MDE6324295.1 glycosyltransferase family 9 protein [Paramuribaculum sp.]